MGNTVDKVLSVAESEIGYLEKSKVAYLNDKTVLYRKTDGAGQDNYTKYGKEMHDIYPSVMDFPASWCDVFVDWCFYQAYGVTNAKGLLGGNFNDYTVASAQLYKNKNAWYTSNPQIGDQIFFKNSTRICHTGLVYKVDSNYVYTIEGNTSGANGIIANGGGVCKKKYPLNYSLIAGYGRPKYDIETLQTFRINAGKNGIRTTADLNIRNNPGTENTTVIGAYKKDTYIFPTEKVFVKSSPWYKTDKGWVSAKYCADGWIQEENGKWWWILEGYNAIIDAWRNINGKWYRFDTVGYMQTGWVNDNDKWYYLADPDGHMLTDTYIKSAKDNIQYYVDKNGAWDSSKDKKL